MKKRYIVGLVLLITIGLAFVFYKTPLVDSYVKEGNVNILFWKSYEIEETVSREEQIISDVAPEEQLKTVDVNEYEKYLTFKDVSNIESLYFYDFENADISMQQVIELCAEMLKEEEPDLLLERVMEYEEEGYVGYRFNLREIGEGQWKQIVENRIGTLGEEIVYDGIKYEVYMYEYIIDDVETGEAHIAVTATFHIFSKDKLIILEV